MMKKSDLLEKISIVLQKYEENRPIVGQKLKMLDVSIYKYMYHTLITVQNELATEGDN